MSPLWRDELRVGLGPDRLVLARCHRGLRRRISYDVRSTPDPLRELESLSTNVSVSVVLSSHYVRYLLLGWSSALTTSKEWAAYAMHAFANVYGSEAASWTIRVSDTGRHLPRIACAVDGRLIEALRALPGLVSVQPYLMAAFNPRRRELARRSSWLVLQEPRKLTLALIAGGAWKLVRTRQIHGCWRDSLADVLDREHVASEQPECGEVIVCAEEEPPARAGRYNIVDATLPLGAGNTSRPLAMVLH